jgi:muramoyltetrapeptide carboxypeptidase
VSGDAVDVVAHLKDESDLGLFEDFHDLTDRGWTLADVLQDRLGALGVPVLGGLPAGHGGVGDDARPDQYAIPLGTTATLDTTAGTLTAPPCVQ